MAFLDEVAFAVEVDDAMILLDRYVLRAPRDGDGVTLWRALALAVTGGTAAEVRRQARLLLRGPRPGRPPGGARPGESWRPGRVRPGCASPATRSSPAAATPRPCPCGGMSA
jgi:hypothetical protein